MASKTQNLELYKADPVADAEQSFNITTMLNDNWDKLDAFAGSLSGAAIIKAGSYAGNGGPSVSISVDFVPDLIYVRRAGAPKESLKRYTGLAAVAAGYLGSALDPYYDNAMKYNALAYNTDTDTLAWSDSGSAEALFNAIDVQYVYVILGHREVSA